MKENLLQLELRLLIHKYGYDSVLQVLADTKGNSLKEIELLLSNLEKKTVHSKAPSKKKSELEIAEEVIKNSEHYSILKQLAVNYQNKTFLPQLKDVKRLLEQHGVKSKGLKSRLLATRKVFGLIKRLDKKELHELMLDEKENGETTFSALASEIIGDNKQINLTR